MLVNVKWMFTNKERLYAIQKYGIEKKMDNVKGSHLFTRGYNPKIRNKKALLAL